MGAGRHLPTVNSTGDPGTAPQGGTPEVHCWKHYVNEERKRRSLRARAPRPQGFLNALRDCSLNPHRCPPGRSHCHHCCSVYQRNPGKQGHGPRLEVELGSDSPLGGWPVDLPTRIPSVLRRRFLGHLCSRSLPWASAFCTWSFDHWATRQHWNQSWCQQALGGQARWGAELDKMRVGQEAIKSRGSPGTPQNTDNEQGR